MVTILETNNLIITILTFLGVIFIFYSLITVRKYTIILDKNNYHTRRWLIVAILMIFFIIGYLLNIYFVLSGITPPVDPFVIVSLVYFFGAIFVIITINSIHRTLIILLGDTMSESQAIDLFTLKFGVIENVDFARKYPLKCEKCNKEVNYSILDVIRNYALNIEQGIQVQSTFGVRNFIFRPTHKCLDGRREIKVIHDDNLEFRAVDKSRLIISGEI